MAEQEHVWLLTTTLPDGTFDFFRFMERLHTAPLLELYMELLYVNLAADEYEALSSATFGKDREAMEQKAKLYNGQWAAIDNEICDRIYPDTAPQCPN